MAPAEKAKVIRGDAALQLGLDCVAELEPGRSIAYGWAMTPRGVPTELAVGGEGGAECPIEHCSFHARPDIHAEDPRNAAVNGFTLVFQQPPDGEPLSLSLAAGEAVLRADLRGAGIEHDLARATTARAPRITFALLQEAATAPALAPLLRHRGVPFGAFAEWMSRMPMLRGRADGVARMAEAEALSARSGEVLAMLRAGHGLPPDARLGVVVIGWLRGAGEALPEPVPLAPADLHVARLPAALAAYARLDPALLDRLQAVELVLHVEPRPGEEAWLRCQPATATVPDLLDAAGRGLARSLALPVEAAATAGLDLVRQVIARREAAFAPTLAALGASGPRDSGPRDSGRHPARLALILGADDPMAARLFHATAAEFERRCDTLLVMGAAADEVAQEFARRGRIGVLSGVEAQAALRDAAGRDGILVVEAAAFAHAVAEGRPEAAFTRPLDAAEVARLLALHAVAGCSPALADSLQRLLRLREAAVRDEAEAAFAPVARPWANRHAGELANAHLRRLWTAAPLLGPEPAQHA